MAAHGQATMARIREHAVVLCLQDTTELDYNGQAMTGLGPLSYEAQRGLYLHPTYVVTPQREPLEVTCLIASEINTPASAKPVVWRC